MPLPLADHAPPGGANVYVAVIEALLDAGAAPTNVGVAEKPLGPLTVTSPVPRVL